MRTIILVVAIAFGSTSVAAAGNWDSFIEKPGDKVPVAHAKATPVKAAKAEKPAKPVKVKKAKQARGKKH